MTTTGTWVNSGFEENPGATIPPSGVFPSGDWAPGSLPVITVYPENDKNCNRARNITIARADYDKKSEPRESQKLRWLRAILFLSPFRAVGINAASRISPLCFGSSTSSLVQRLKKNRIVRFAALVLQAQPNTLRAY
ncbi:hypothetical protein KQX54_019168 [Cotesia glomerata]|uniref:Uncharacterized protein n=1 Tax=Cotesia glomerata TaxID=32391 RepID=A0AAV7HT73_COTGL|nr:hypothetical protein KQX54_019168 [Cotesia glomerata]